jgi:hypothetical protein
VKVVIIGKGRGLEYAPSGKNIDVWGITQVILSTPVDLVIDMNIYDDGRWGEQEKDEARKSKEICDINKIPYIDLTNYPLKEITDYFNTDYFSSTVDFAIAYALYSGYKEIDLYGVNMEDDTEYQYQKASVEFWIGIAKGMGVRIKVFGDSSSILRTRDKKVYGYDIPQKFKQEKGVVFV